MTSSTVLGPFGPLSASIAADLAAINAHSGVPCEIGTTDFDAAREIIGKDILQSLGISGVRGTIIKLHANTTDLPGGGITPIRNQTPITVNGQPFLVRDSYLEGDGSLTVLFCEQVP
jgi:hypothetical protein